MKTHEDSTYHVLDAKETHEGHYLDTLLMDWTSNWYIEGLKTRLRGLNRVDTMSRYPLDKDWRD